MKWAESRDAAPPKRGWGGVQEKRESAGSSPDPFLRCSQCFTCILLITQMQECISIVKCVQHARGTAGKLHQILSNSTLLMYHTTPLNKQSSANNSLWPEVKPQQVIVILCISCIGPSQMPLSKALHSKHLWFYSVKHLKTRIFGIWNCFAVEVKNNWRRKPAGWKTTWKLSVLSREQTH